MSRNSMVRQAHRALSKATSTRARKRKGLSVDRMYAPTGEYGFVGGAPVLLCPVPASDLAQLRAFKRKGGAKK